MLRHTGKAAAEVGQTLHRVCHIVLSLIVLLSLAAIAGAWRLSHAPVDLDFIKDRVERAVNQGINPIHITIGGASIAWRGFSGGLDQPLVLRVTDLTVAEGAGVAQVHIPVAEAALSARWLLIGRIVPRAITLEGARLMVVRSAEGSFSFDIGDPSAEGGTSPLSGLLALLGEPAGTDRQEGGGQLSQLSAVAIHGATLSFDDRLTKVNLSAERAGIDLSRHSGGGVDGRVALDLVLGGQKAALTGTFNLAPAGRSTHVAARLSQVTPRALADATPILKPLAPLDIPVTLDGDAELGPDLTPSHIRVTVHAGAGRVTTGDGSIPIHRAEFSISGTQEQATLEDAVVELQPTEGGALTTLRGGGQLTHQAGRIGAALHLTLDRVGMGDLPVLWPADISPNTRSWITQNITTGTAHDGSADLVLDASDDASNVTLTKAAATLEGDDIAATWLPTVPRMEQGKTHVVLTDPDKVEIDVRSARQKVNGADPIAIPYGHVTITGLSQKDQIATIQCEANGSIPSAITFLKEPRLHILDRHPMELRDPAGDVRMSIHAVVPLELNLLIDDVAIHGAGSLNKVHLTGIVAGHDLDDGTFSLDADTNRLSLKGSAKLAGIQSNIDGMLDFRAGPRTQVTQRFVAAGRTTARALADAGLDAGDALSGDIGLNAILTEYRSGDGEVTADADLTQAVMAASPLDWRKPAGTAARASVRLTLSNDKLTGIDKLAIDGPGLQVRGGITVAGGKLDTIRLDRMMLGRTDVKGTIRIPAGGPIGVDVTGLALDVATKLMETSPKRDPAAPRPPPGPAWSMRGRFDRVFLAHDQSATQVVVSADSDGEVFRALSIVGKAGANKPFSVRIARGQTAARHLALKFDDAGNLLDGLDVTDSILGGVLTVEGAFDDSTRDHGLAGTIEMTDFRVAHAPALGKLLQAVTLYGLVDALGGEGLSFSQLTAPFQLTADALVLKDARAFSPSLGLTAQGWISRTGDRLDMEGTVVPAYVFNSLLGRIPILGTLFSIEKGGGLFAMNYSLRGPMNDPAVSANPLSAITPGILRGMFGLIGQGPVDRQPGTAPGTPLDPQRPGGNAQSP